MVTHAKQIQSHLNMLSSHRMPTCCCVYGCHNRGGHEFPKDRASCKAWVIAILPVEDKRGQLWWPTTTSLVCREHFKQDDEVQQTCIGKYLNRCVCKYINSKCIVYSIYCSYCQIDNYVCFADTASHLGSGPLYDLSMTQALDIVPFNNNGIANKYTIPEKKTFTMTETNK